ncbi:MAG: hypothetical protein Fur0042_09560 [Cyanophyceae cyanobacterium]
MGSGRDRGGGGEGYAGSGKGAAVGWDDGSSDPSVDGFWGGVGAARAREMI